MVIWGPHLGRLIVDQMRHAAEQGWRLREFRRPVRMRSRLQSLPAPPGPASAYAAAAAAAGVLSLAWWATGQRRR